MLYFHFFFSFSPNKNQNDEFAPNTFYKMAQGLVSYCGERFNIPLCLPYTFQWSLLVAIISLLFRLG